MRQYVIFLLLLAFVLLALGNAIDIPNDKIAESNEIVYKIYNSHSDGPIWMESHRDINPAKIDKLYPGGKIALPSIEDGEYYLEVVVDGETFGERIRFTSREELDGMIMESRGEGAPSEPSEPGDVMDAMAVGLTIQGPDGTENTRVMGDLGIGTPAGTDPSARLDVRGDHVLIWNGGPTPGYANAAGDLYVENELEVDGTIYATNWRSGIGGNMLTNGAGISVGEDGNGQWTITNTDPDQTVSVAGGTGISVSGSYPSFTVTNDSPSSGGTVTSIATSAPITGGTITTSGTIGLQQAGDIIGGTGITVSGGTNVIPGSDDVTINYTGSSGDADWTISGSNQYSAVSGNVGIGTTSPSSKLHVEGRTANIGQSNSVTSPTGTWGANIAIGATNNITGGRGSTVMGYGNNSSGDFGTILGVRNDITSSVSGGHVFGLDNTVSATDAFAIGSYVSNSIGNSIQLGWNSSSAPGALVIRDSGNIGINTTSPASDLDVNGTIRADHYRDNAGGNLLNAGTNISVAEQADGSWTINSTASADNLGDHNATMDLDMNSNDIIDVGYISTGSSVTTYPRLWFGPSWLDVQTNASYPFLEINNSYHRSESGYTYLIQGSTTASNYFIRGDASGNVNVRNDLLVGDGITLGGVTRTTWPSGEWYDGGTYLRTNENGETVRPYSDNNADLGTSSYEWRNLYIDNYAYIDYLDVDFTAYIDALNMDGDIDMDGYDINDLDNIRGTYTAIDVYADFDMNNNELENCNAIELGGVRRTSWPTGGGSSYWTDHGSYLSPASGEDVYSDGDFIAASGNGVINCGGGAMDASANIIADGTVNDMIGTGDEDLYIYDDLEVDGGIALGNVLQSTWPSGGGSGEWTDAGSYLYPSDGSDVRIYESTETYHIYTSHNFDNYGIYFYRSSSFADGTDYDYNDTKTNFLGANYYGEPYSFGVHGASYLDYNRSGGTFGGDWFGGDWGCLAYQNSSGTEYGGYFAGGYTGGSGLLRMTEGSSSARAGLDGEAHINIGIGAWGNLFGQDIHGTIYGSFVEGGRYASYDHGDRYTDGLDIHLQDISEENKGIMYTTVSEDAIVTSSGISELEEGNQRVDFDESFRKLISEEERIVVNLTPIGDCNGIHIVEVDSDGFSVAENLDGKNTIEFTWVAYAKRRGYENPSLPGEVTRADYVEKIQNGLKPDNEFKGDGPGLYFENGTLYNDRHPNTLISDELAAMKEDFSENPTLKSYDEWSEAFESIGEPMPMKRKQFEDHIAQYNEPIAYYDRYGNQIPPDWVEELKAEGLEMYTYDEMRELVKQDYIKNARARTGLEAKIQKQLEEEKQQVAEMERLKEQRQKEVFFDQHGNQIPMEWVDTLKAAGYPMLSYEEAEQRRLEGYLSTADNIKKSQKYAEEPKYESERIEENLIRIKKIKTGEVYYKNLKGQRVEEDGTVIGETSEDPPIEIPEENPDNK